MKQHKYTQLTIFYTAYNTFTSSVVLLPNDTNTEIGKGETVDLYNAVPTPERLRPI